VYARCENRFLCRTCRGIWIEETAPLLLRVIGAMRGPLRFVTLTLRNDRDLDQAVHRIRKAFTRLRHRRFWSSRVSSAAYAIETTYNRDTGEWHVHLHLVCEGRFIPQAELSAEWLAVTGDSYIVDVRAVTSPREGVKELVKYTLKDAGVPPRQLQEAAAVLHGRRLVGVVGRLYGVWNEQKQAAQGHNEPWLCEVCRVGHLVPEAVFFGRGGVLTRRPP
jgi:hypothetical protein